jgi:hypothetical protein
VRQIKFIDFLINDYTHPTHDAWQAGIRYSLVESFFLDLTGRISGRRRRSYGYYINVYFLLTAGYAFQPGTVNVEPLNLGNRSPL